jgi:3-dehydroquinate synthase
MKELTVDLGDRSYPIYIGEGLLGRAADFFAKHQIPTGSPVLIVTDDKVAPYHLRSLEDQLQTAGYRIVVFVAESGESSKSLQVFDKIITLALQEGLDRTSTVVALGGGVVGDLAGYVAASYMRGIRFVQVPTTILAHDSSVGGKVAVNHPLAKNIIGAFHQPEMVLYDIASLRTLPEREVRAGFSEMIKHGLIWDPEFVAWCDENTDRLLALDPEALEYGLYQGCRVKSIVVSQDEREGGLRQILNLGHTIGHALEAVGGYGELLHGEAISIGMVGAARLAVRLGHPESVYTETKRLLAKFGLPVRLPAHLDTDSIMEAMMRDKKFKEGKMVFIIPVEIGKVEIYKQMSADWVKQVVEELKQEA